jgi:hypothetical protein
MVNALIKLDENINRVLNIVKVKHGLRDKSEAIKFIIDKYIDDEAEPDLKPEFIEKMKKRRMESTVKITDFKKHFGLN